MQLACPACSATYRVPDTMIGAGRMMRCARCGHDWFAAPPAGGAVPAPAAAVAKPAATPTAGAAPAPAPPPAAATAPAPALARSAAAAPPPAPTDTGAPARAKIGARAALGLAWLASLGLVAWGAHFAWTERAVMTALWPSMAKLYRLLGA